MRVLSLHRYPVKSLLGEALEAAQVDARGLSGDRRWAVVHPDGKLGSGKSSRRFRRTPGLLDLAAVLVDGRPVVRLPDGRSFGPGPGADAALAERLGVDVALREEDGEPFFDDGPVHLVTTSSLARLRDELGHDVPAGRFRANVVVETGDSAFAEDAWVGRGLALGEVRLRVAERMPRCVMVGMEQGALPDDRAVLPGVHRVNEGTFGVWATVVRPGRVAVGDPVALV
ncbi:MOSC domain-containing protein [Vallicoccus soli]|uniref:MOSC domain-containing protein n=1 Tax=Vallicoccus soli TaxID=2339232 RepID=A0A3A3Z305_9ACTN|nr:MOSC domain-containing protein [Vallicoccus soli]RJK97792.1 MOSC domain-containing protein [Vallicoccus soli]